MAPKTHRLTVLGKYCTTIGEHKISYVLKRSSRIRYVRIEMRAQTGVTVVVPRGFDIGKVTSLIKNKKNWILNRLARLGQVQSPSFTALKDGDTIPYLGRDLKLAVQRRQGPVEVRVAQDSLIINLNSSDGNLSLIVEKWYRFIATQILAKKVQDINAELKLSYNRVSIRGQRTRWGSCSQRGNLSFNWKLVMSPEPVIDYVVTHELIHLKEMSHSRRFWDLVAKHCPDWQKRKNWLKEHEGQLNARFQT